MGTDAGAAAGDYVSKRFADAGLATTFDPFDFPRYDLDASASSLAVTVDGAASSPGFDVFEASGVGHADADVVYVGTAQPNDVASVDLTGKIALVERNRFYHRSSQVANVVATTRPATRRTRSTRRSSPTPSIASIG